ncbi:MAG: hypothetical protein ACYDAY_05690 [Candidatus Dormibacteria bacterium]
MSVLIMDTSSRDQAVLWLDPPTRVGLTWEAGDRGRAATEIAALVGARGRPSVVAVGRGPGGFTQLRTGMALGCGLAWALGAELRAFSSLEWLAARAPAAAFAVIDGGGELLYLRESSTGLERAVARDRLPATVSGGGLAFIGAGSGQAPPSGVALVPLGDALDALADLWDRGATQAVAYDQVQPAYLQEPAALRRRGQG